MLPNGSRTSRAATCEEWDEDAQATLPNTTTSANVAAKRSKPELVPTKPSKPRTVEGAGERMSRRYTSTQEDASVRKEKWSAGLKLHTSFPERESRPYSSGPAPERLQRSTSRPAAKRSTSKAERLEPLLRHQIGQCWICDTYGYHMMVPLEPQGSSMGNSAPQSPLTTPQQPSHQAPPTTKRPQASTVQSRPNKAPSNRDQRPVSFHAGMSHAAFHPLSSQPLSAPDWNMLPSLVPQYLHAPYAQTPTMNFQPYYQDFPLCFPKQYSQQAPPPPRPRPPEPHRSTSARGEPIIQQSPVSREQPPLTRTTSRKEHQRSRNPSLSREEDTRKMPPPRRPSMTKANTSLSTPISHQPERSDRARGTLAEQSSAKERRSDPPPSSYREPPLSSYHNPAQDRPVPRKSTSYVDPKFTLQANSSGPGLVRQTSTPTAECHEVEAEAYQRSFNTNLQPLTVDAVSKISRRSDSSSQHSINTSSRGSSGGKTKTTVASSDITMTINGVTLGISGDSAETHSIQIQPKRNGGISISVDGHESCGRDNKVRLPKRSDSTASSSRQSQRSRVKEVRTSRDDSSDRELDRATTLPNRSDKASFDEPLGYGVGYG